MSYPILEHDATREALIEPSKIIKPRDVPKHCVICFFGEVIEKVVAEHSAHRT
jgi:uridine phosphorylase